MRQLVLAALIYLLFCCKADAQAQNIFFQPPAYPVFTNISADLNGDGKTDLIGLDGTILLGNADGTLHSGTPWCTSSQPFCNQSSVIVGDFNNDGKPDLLILTTGFFWILLGNGDVTFQPALSISSTGVNFAGQLAVADVNGDGKLDVLVASGSTILIFIGIGDGAFQPPLTGPTLAGVFTLAATGDFNGDGKLDLLAFSAPGNSAPQLGVVLGNGNGTFQPTPIITTTTAPTSVTSATAVIHDVNGDHNLDVILSFSAGSSTHPLSSTLTLLGNGDGTFIPGQLTSGTSVVGDFNGDGIADMVAANGPFVQISLGKGDGTFDLKDSYFTGLFGAAPFNPNIPIAVGDFNGDGKLDAVGAGVLLLGNGDGTLRGNDASLLNSAPVIVGDFNGDGKLDLAALTNTSIHILLGDGAGKFPAELSTAPVQPGPNIAVLDLKVGDVNGDGRLDLLVVTADSTTGHWTLSVLLGNGNATFAAPMIAEQGQFTYERLAIGDFNQDGKLDVAIVDSSGALNVFLGIGDGTFHSSQSFFAATNVQSLVAVDFNNDGKLDLLFSSPNGENVCVGNADGTFGAPTVFYGAVGPIWAVSDLNRDGVPDLITEGVVLLGNGNGTARPLPLGLPTPNATYVVAEDINGDGKLDLIGHSGFIPGALQYVLGNGDGTFGTPVVLELVQNRFFPYTNLLGGDFNDDGRPDLVFGFGGAEISLLNIAAAPAPDFVIAASVPSPLVVAPGNSATSTVALTAIGGFTGNVTLSCSGLPTAATCTFSPSSINGTGSSTVTINTGSSTPVGTYPLAIVGTAGVATHNVGLTLGVASSAGTTTSVISPNFLNFGIQAPGISSSPQMLQLTNSGTASLTIASGGIALSGPNAADFSISNNTCGSLLAPATSCAISLIFTPTGSGNRSASLMITDNATASPQFASLSGTTPDFSVTATSTPTATVTPGQTATYSLSIAASAGFTGNVSLTCSGAPALSNCTVAPPSVTLGGTPSNVMVSVVTIAASKGVTLPSEPLVNRQIRPALPFVFSTLIATALVLLLRHRRVRFAYAFPLAMVLAGAVAFGACGGGSTSSSGGNGGNGGSSGTRAGTYTITVSATAASGSAMATHNLNLILTVQ